MTTLEEANALVRGIFEEVARLEEHIALLDAAIADHHNQVTHRAPIDLDRARMHAMERNRARVEKIEAERCRTTRRIRRPVEIVDDEEALDNEAGDRERVCSHCGFPPPGNCIRGCM